MPCASMREPSRHHKVFQRRGVIEKERRRHCPPRPRTAIDRLRGGLGRRLGIAILDDPAPNDLGGEQGEHRGQEDAEQRVEPDERDEERPESEARPQYAEWSVRDQGRLLGWRAKVPMTP